MDINIKKAIKRYPTLHRNLVSAKYRLLALVPDKIYISHQYKKRTGKVLNLKNPKTFNEKIQWLKLNWRNDICTICADKYEVRKFVEDRLGKEVLIDLYGVYDRVEDIDITKLPKSFVLKVNHGSGQNIICKDKSEMDWEHAFRTLKYYLRANHYYVGREWAYKNIIPKIICEKYLEENGKPPKDYKFFCFNGKPRIVQVDIDRFENHKRNMYDMDWNILDFELHYPKTTECIEKPPNFEKMIEYASKLSEGIPFVRVDLYYVNNKIYFGEMTFYPENGGGIFYPEKYDYILGTYLDLPIN